MSEPETFLSVVDRLTKETHTYIDTDDGKQLVRRDGLLKQLREAVFSGMENGGSGSAFGSKPPIDASALDLLDEITAQATEALAASSKGPTPYGQAETYVRLWAAHARENELVSVTTKRLAAYDATQPRRPLVYRHVLESSAMQLVLSWADRIENFLNPPRDAEIKAPCPQCGVQYVWRERDGETVSVPSFNFIRDRKTDVTIAAKCSACGSQWSPDRFGWLAENVGARLPEMSAADGKIE